MAALLPNPLREQECQCLDTCLDNCAMLRDLIARAERAGWKLEGEKAEVQSQADLAAGTKREFMPMAS